MKTFVAWILLLLFSQPAWACSCASSDLSFEQQVQQAYQQAKVVVLAKAERVRDLVPDPQEEGFRFREKQVTQFVSLKNWKGLSPGRFRTEIETTCCVCGYRFKAGTKYLLYLSGPNEQGAFQTSICSRTKVADKFAQDEIDLLDKLYATQ